LAQYIFRTQKAPWIAMGLLLLWLSIENISLAQNPDSIKIKKEKPDYSLLPKNPKKATLLSAMVPGLGQVYNNKVWKTPIVYGAFITDLYFIQYNNRRYDTFIQALKSFDKGETTQFPSLNRVALVRNVDFWRRNRDLTILLMGVIYALNIVDANVDAHLSGFEISDDLALDIKPHFESFSTHNNTIGISLHFRFKP
jgi:hypothetical protein